MKIGDTKYWFKILVNPFYWKSPGIICPEEDKRLLENMEEHTFVPVRLNGYIIPNLAALGTDVYWVGNDSLYNFDRINNLEDLLWDKLKTTGFPKRVTRLKAWDKLKEDFS